MRTVVGLWMFPGLLSWLVSPGVCPQPQVQRSVLVAPPPAGVKQSTDGTAVCHFPFVYRNESHLECLQDTLGLQWCGITADVDSDRRWRYCARAPIAVAGDDYNSQGNNDDYDDDEEDDSNVLNVLDHSSKDRPCKGMTCLFGGVCKVEVGRPGRNGTGAEPVCMCRPPFHGKNCHMVRNPCRRGTCHFRGACLLRLDDPARPKCRCQLGFWGSHCGKSESVTPSNSTSTVPPLGSPAWVANVSDPFPGSAVQRNPCVQPNPCLNGGACFVVRDKWQRSAVTCTCPSKFHGFHCNLLKGDCYQGKGSNYRGTMSVTEGRRRCLHWNSPLVLRQQHSAFSAQARDSGIGDHNYCRNPDGNTRPWCYFINRDSRKVDRAHCKLQQCQGQKQQGSLGDGAAATCGRTWLGTLQARVVKGRDAGLGTRPWQASVQLRGEGAPVHRCGGVLVHPCWVLTAAHCFSPRKPAGSYLVRLGKRKLHTHESGEQDFNVSKVIVHPNYSERTHDADIALLRLWGHAGECAHRTTVEVVPVCLPEAAEPARPGTLCHISGWGTVGYHGATTPVLQEAEVPVVAMDACNSSLGYNGQLTAGMLCAGNWEQGGPDACKGDSGGPLTCAVQAAGGEESSVLHGIVSHGRGCGEKYRPGVYTRVSAFVTWIHSSMADNGTAATGSAAGGAAGSAQLAPRSSP
ncbi:urokinase-type plasminogen activator-like [Lethenteron reissneri]|uniref:urokinase-type plasminogen activator-like n=1 Tax=Lethenteron reissneri TaxID=7753 RepID=UPI002AB672C6|nr:urokinase-type plasminogen activator-like [Lethenteron reissneri]